MNYAIKPLLSAAFLTLGAAAMIGCGGSHSASSEAVVPDPPQFTKCVAAKKDAPVPKGQEKPTDAALKKQCEQEYDTLKREVMLFLIQAEWVEQEAEEQGVEVSDASVKKSFEDQKKQAFPTDKAYNEFIKTSGMTEEDILFRVKLNELQQKLTQKVTEDATKVTDADIEEYYEKNKRRFAQPERRDLRVVLTKTEAKAEQARSALNDGESWKQVVKEYSIDESVKEFREDYREQTECAEDYRIEECSNAPKEEDTGPASGGNPGATPQPDAGPVSSSFGALEHSSIR